MNTPMKRKWLDYFLIGISLLFLALVGLLTYALADAKQAPIRTFSIPAESMAPTVLVGDYIIADTFTYRNSAPKRGDVVIFKHPRDSGTDYIKRVIGLPGDQIQYVKGQVFLNEKPLNLQEQKNTLAIKSLKRGRVYSETLPSGRSYQTISLMENSPQTDNTKVFLVPKGHYFVSGDNRDNSTDSRFSNVGFVPRKNIYGKARVICWSKDFSRIGTLLNN